MEDKMLKSLSTNILCNCHINCNHILLLLHFRIVSLPYWSICNSQVQTTAVVPIMHQHRVVFPTEYYYMLHNLLGGKKKTKKLCIRNVSFTFVRAPHKVYWSINDRFVFCKFDIHYLFYFFSLYNKFII